MKIRRCSTLAAQDFWALIMMSWPPELFREVRTRKFSNGVSNAADAPAKRKSRSGMLFLPNAAGEMRRAPTCKRPRSDHTGAIATIFRLGWICMTSKKAEHRGDDFVPLGIGPCRSFHDARFGSHTWITDDDRTAWSCCVLER